MGHIISGYILSHSFGENVEEIYSNNLNVLEDLPNRGAYLIRSMFSIVPPKQGNHVNTFQIIHFSASYDEMHAFDLNWVNDFEELIKKLSWCFITVFQSYSGMRIEYQSEDHIIDSEAIPTLKWSSKYYDSYHDIKEISSSEATY